jgi:dTDP-4-amino-4,6-dideoxygalactose transaminase
MHEENLVVALKEVMAPILTHGSSTPKKSAPSSYPIRLSRHRIEEEDVWAVTELLRSGEDLSRGRQTRAFEGEFAAYVGAKYAVACSSGTAALWLACNAIDAIDTVGWIVPAITFAATRNATQDGMLEICDVDPETGLMDGPQEASALLRLPVHYAGQIAGRAEVEDAAHALGSRYDTGTLIGSGGGLACCFSFHPTKTITTGEGGMVTTEDEGLANEMRRLRDNGVVRSKADPPGYCDNTGYGLNFHMSEIAAALGRSQLRRIDGILENRQRLAACYLRILPKTVLPVVRSEKRNACHIFPVLIDFQALGTTRERVMYELAWRGIETNVHYVPLKRGLPGAEEFYRRELTLPLHCGMSLEDVGYVCDALEEVLA